jgi:hypothetical protein
VLDEVLVVAVSPVQDGDVARLQALVPGAGLVAVRASRTTLEQEMDAVEQQLVALRELGGFLQMSPDGFAGVVRLVVDTPVPRLRAWAAAHLPPGALEVSEQEPGPAR